MTTHYEFEEQDREILMAEVSAITERAVEAGLSYRVKTSKAGDWHKAVVTVYASTEAAQ